MDPTWLTGGTILAPRNYASLKKKKTLGFAKENQVGTYIHE